MSRLILVAALLSGGSARAVDPALVASAEQAMQRAVRYLRTEVAYGGGYLGAYLPDLSDQWGEVRATRTQNWIQPPGSPSTGFAFLDCWRATGEQFFLDGAVEVARALVAGQLECGGWTYIVDHDPAAETRYFYRRNRDSDDQAKKRGLNQGTFDDNTTQHATRLLMAVDQALGFADTEIHEAAEAALEFALTAQRASGAWPQRFPPVGRGYSDFYTFNDNTIRDCVDVMMIAHRTYGGERYLEAVRACGEFIIKTQLPPPHPIWAQQYDFDLKPAWARRFEPPSACAGETVGILQLLVDIALFCDDERYLEPIPAALEWYETSKLPDGRLARYYELGTNRPLYMISGNRQRYWLTYDDGDIPDHYAFKGTWSPAAAARRYALAKEIGLAEMRAQAEPRPLTEAEIRQRAEAAEADVRKVLEAQDEQGRWLAKGAGYGPRDQSMLFMAVMQRNLRLLANYVVLARPRE